ncbi:hypothetical protein CR513_14878, partial [Mucuna pruriens]
MDGSVPDCEVLDRVFKVLRKLKLKLNPKNVCSAFKLSVEKALSFFIASERMKIFNGQANASRLSESSSDSFPLILAKPIEVVSTTLVQEVGLVITARKLRPYFQSHRIMETGLPIKQILSVNGGSNQKGSGACVILEGPYEVLIGQSLRFGFRASNNQAKYEALLVGIRLVEELRGLNLNS